MAEDLPLVATCLASLLDNVRPSGVSRPFRDGESRVADCGSWLEGPDPVGRWSCVLDGGLCEGNKENPPAGAAGADIFEVFGVRYSPIAALS
jgi:hypothetical protein